MKISSIQETQQSFNGKAVGRLSKEGYKNLQELLTKMNKSSVYPNADSFEGASAIFTLLPKGKGNGGFADYRFLNKHVPENAQMVGKTSFYDYIERKSNYQELDIEIDNHTGNITKKSPLPEDAIRNFFRMFTGNWKPISKKEIMERVESAIENANKNFNSIEKVMVKGEALKSLTEAFGFIQGLKKIFNTEAEAFNSSPANPFEVKKFDI